MNSYKTKDLYEAALLYAAGIGLMGLDGEGKQMWFVFGDREESERLANSYWSRLAEVNAKDYADAIRSLKDRLFARR